MAYKKDKKTLPTDRCRISITDAFEKQWKARGQIQKLAVAAALRLWISLPEDLQATLISQEDCPAPYRAPYRMLRPFSPAKQTQSAKTKQH